MDISANQLTAHQILNGRCLHCRYLVEQSIIKPPNVVKIDVEGAEYNVLQEMREVIKQYKPVIVFEISQDTYDFNTTPKQIIDYLSESAAYKFLGPLEVIVKNWN